jgi:transposase
VEFDPEAGRLDLHLDFPRGQRFPCPEGDEAACPIHDTKEKVWRHLDFFQRQAYLHARVPRVQCPIHGTLQVEVPWARPDSGFTLLFEALLLEFAPHMPVAAIARLVREHDTRVWRVLEHYVAAARAGLDLSGVTRVGVDETSARRGQDYVSIFMDMEQPRVVYATEGRDSGTVERFAEDLKSHQGNPEQVVSVTCDMSQAFRSGVNQHLPAAEITYDQYHVVAQLNEAVDQVRRQEAHSRPELAGSRYLWLKNGSGLSEKEQRQRLWLSRPSAQLATARAWRWKEDFNGFYQQPTEQAERYLERWCYGAQRSRLEPIKDFVRMVQAHWEGICPLAPDQILHRPPGGD